MLTTSKGDSDERLGGTTALWMLSFDAINRALIKAFTSATDTLQRFAQDSDEKVPKPPKVFFGKLKQKTEILQDQVIRIFNLIIHNYTLINFW